MTLPADLIARLHHRLIVSCQPVPDGPFDSPAMVVAFARAAAASGAGALRIEGVANIRAVAHAVPLPVIGIIKRDLPDSAVRITPFPEDVLAIAGAGAAIVAFDATDRPRPCPAATLREAARGAGCLAMADVATLDEGRAAGTDLVGSTLAGYVAGPPPTLPDLALVQSLSGAGLRAIAEGNIRTPAQAAAAIRAGAWAVVAGSAITRPEHVTAWFAEAIDHASGEVA